MPGDLEFYAGAELFSQELIWCFFSTKTFLFYLYHGERNSNSLYISTVIMRLHAAYNNSFEKFEPPIPFFPLWLLQGGYLFR